MDFSKIITSAKDVFMSVSQHDKNWFLAPWMHANIFIEFTKNIPSILITKKSGTDLFLQVGAYPQKIWFQII